MSYGTWPVPGITNITSYFGYRDVSDIPGATSNHKGIDIGAPYGTPIVAIQSGKVIASGNAKGYGQWIKIDHGDGLVSIYGHMQTRVVQKDAIVEAGDVIAYVGSEGVSSGPHLHLQLELNGKAVNPLSYVSTDGVSNIEYAEDQLGISTGGQLIESGPLHSETVEGNSKQPLLAFIELVVGGQCLTLLPPRHIVSLEFTKSIEDEAHSFTLVLFDDNWEEVEILCSNNQDDVQLRYGYTTGNHSKTYNCILQEYTIDFTTTGVLLTIKGMTTGPTTNLTNMTMNTGTLNPTEAAKKICKKIGWIVEDQNFHPSKSITSSNIDSFALVKERPATYIIQKLAPLALDEEGRGGFRFYLDESTKPPTAHFKPVDYVENTRRTYTYMKGVNSPVIDLQLKVNGVWGGNAEGRLVTTGESSSFIDPETKKEYKSSEIMNRDVPVAVGEYSHTKSSQYIASLDAAGSTKSEMDAILKYRATTMYVPYEGFLTIVGDPTIDLSVAGESSIRLLIIDDFGILHHTSGLYMIKAVTDSIVNGVMTTNIHIVRTEDTMTGVELVNYRKRIR